MIAAFRPYATTHRVSLDIDAEPLTPCSAPKSVWKVFPVCSCGWRGEGGWVQTPELEHVMDRRQYQHESRVAACGAAPLDNWALRN